MPRAVVMQFLDEFPDHDVVSVWHPGLEDWQPARQLFEAAAPLAVSDTPQQPETAALDPPLRENFFARYWRGEYSLGTSYWCFVVLGNFAIAILLTAIGALFQIGRGYQPRAIFCSLLSIWAVSLFFAAWQTVGAWRSANRHEVWRRAAGKRARWALAAKIALLLGVLSSATAFATAGWPQLREASRMAFLNDPSIPPYSIRVMRNGTEAEITGGFKYGLTEDFSEMLKTSPAVTVVHLNSVGGRIGEAIRLNGMLRARGMDTYVSSGCYSACTLAFAAGRRRILRNGAVLGFHAPQFPGMTRRDLEGATQEQKQIFAEAGFDEDFVDKALATPNSDMWKPPADVLAAARVITGRSDGTDFAISGFGTDLSKDHMAAILARSLPVLQAIRDKYPDEYDRIVSSYHDGVVRGQTETEITRIARARVDSIIRNLRPMADDGVLVDLGVLYADQYSALGAESPQLCYQYASGDIARFDFFDDVPRALVARENEINWRVVATAKRREPVPAPAVAELWKKLDTQLAAKGLSDSQINLLMSSKVDAARYGEYCALSVLLNREVARLPPKEAAILMRSLLADK
jgi:hypothetical protein